MLILGIDPGTTESAYVLFDEGKILEKNNACPNNDLRNLLSAEQYPLVAIEKIMSYGMSVGQTIFDTVFWTGRFAEAAKANQSMVLRIPRLDVKTNLCHDSKAKDANIRQALVDRLGPSGTSKHPGPTFGIAADGWAALGVAVTVFDKIKRKEFMEIVK